MKQTDIHLWAYLAQFFLQRKMFQTKVVEKINTSILQSADKSLALPTPRCILFDGENDSLILVLLYI
jgi:hypothetical protein